MVNCFQLIKREIVRVALLFTRVKGTAVVCVELRAAQSNATWQVRIGDEEPAERNGVCITTFEQRFGIRRLIPSGRDEPRLSRDHRMEAIRP